MSEDDLYSMYSKYSSGSITLWCDGRVEDENEGGRIKLKREESCSKQQEKESEVDDVYQDNPFLTVIQVIIASFKSGE